MALKEDYYEVEKMRLFNRPWKEGDVIINESGDKRKILGVCGKIMFPSFRNKFDVASESFCTQKELELVGYKLKTSKTTEITQKENEELKRLLKRCNFKINLL